MPIKYPDRRDVLLGGFLGLVFPVLPSFGKTAQGSGEFNALLEQFMAEKLDLSPELVTSLGLDTGKRRRARRLLDDRSLAAVKANSVLIDRQLERLRTFDRSQLNEAENITYDSLLFQFSTQKEADRKFSYGAISIGRPYVVTQMAGAYTTIPDLLENKHEINTEADVEAYLSRLEAFAETLDQETSRIGLDAERGVIPPDFIIDKICEQLKAFRDRPVESAPLVVTLDQKCRAANLPQSSVEHAIRIYRDNVVPAIDRQHDALAGLRDRAGSEAGMGRLPDGLKYYDLCLKKSATLTVNARELHQRGLNLVTQATKELDALLSSLGFKEGPLSDRLKSARRDERFVYSDTEQGRQQVMHELTMWLDQAENAFTDIFHTIPKTEVVIRPVPSYLAMGSPIGYYEDPSLDGTRPGIFYINLDNFGDTPKWLLPTILYHEAIPGHHFQQALVQELAKLPLIRQIMWFEAYGEGWAFYAEKLAVEAGLYDHNPWGRVGYLWLYLLRAARLVVDTGLHAIGWGRDQAIQWMIDNIWADQTMATTEVERYCIHPGQACSYMIGKLEWLRQRERAQQELGPKFNLGEFHDAGLLCGAVPLELLDQIIERYIKKMKNSI